MKRVGHLYEKVISLENCVGAERDMTRKKRRNPTAKRIKADPERYGKMLSKLLSAGAWEPSPYRERTIYDPLRQKERHLKIPCLLDQAVHHAVMRVTAPLILSRNYYYNCGSIPKAGQSRAGKALKRWHKRPYKYALEMDISKFYDNVQHADVMRALRRIIKDERVLALHERILTSMSPSGVGLAIGFYPSAWYGNLVLAEIDRAIKKYPCRMVRYMDDVLAECNNRRTLWKIHREIMRALDKLKLRLKSNWQVFRTACRAPKFLSYRYFKGFTILTKRLMYHLARCVRRIAGRPLTAKSAASTISRMGVLKHCNSYNFRKNYIYPFVSIKKCKEVVSNAAKNKLCPLPAGA